MDAERLSRRDFLSNSTAAGVSAVVLATADAARAAGANDELSVGWVGTGRRGKELIRTFGLLQQKHRARLTAVCDIWSRNRALGAEHVKQTTGEEPKQFERIEDLLAWSGLDAVIISTPDHAHAKNLTSAIRAGKHVYCEKPFANVMEEATAALDAWRDSQVVATVGTQYRSDVRRIAAAEAIRSGTIGPVVKVDRVFSAHSPFRWRRTAEIPLLKEADTDWKTFLLGRKERPFDPHTYLEFRLYREFSSGIIDQWMSHGIDEMHMLTGAKFPSSVVAHGGTYAWKDKRENPDTVQVLLDYPEGFLVSHSTSLANAYGNGGLILGREGTLEYGTNWRITSEGIAKADPKSRPLEHPPALPEDGNVLPHIDNWLSCIRKGDRKTNCTPEEGFQHSVACIMAAESLFSGRRMVFDAESRSIRAG